jgi:hypothetical protein
MSNPTPLQSFIGGSLLALAADILFTYNGSVFGISGFVHRTFRGSWQDAKAWRESLAGVVGLLLGGVTVGILETAPTGMRVASASGLGRVLLSGLLVGIGTKASVLPSGMVVQRR